MGHKFAEIAFTPSVREIQRELGSRNGYAAMEQGDDYNQHLGEAETSFIAARDSFYIASVSETGWPYLQHRGGPAGFVKVIDKTTLGFADYSGNRQYITTGNLRRDNRVSLFFMDYPNRTRLKLLGRVEVVYPAQTALITTLEDDDYRARIERGMIIRIEAFDWNCPQHITPRYSEAEVDHITQPLLNDIRALQAELVESSTSSPNVIGHGELELTISGIRQLTPRVRAYELRASSNQQLPPVEAGSHLAIPIVLPNGQEVTRYYSVASNPARRDIYEIAVLMEPDGNGGSIAVHQQFKLGTRLNLDSPHNQFKLHRDHRPAVLIAGGIGITPIKAMAQTLDRRGTPYQLHYAGRSRSEMAFAGRLELSLGENLKLYPSDEGKRMVVAEVLTTAPANALFYICGPARLLDAVLAAADAFGITKERLRYERFAPPHRLEDQPVRVELARTGSAIEVAANETILDALLRNNVPVPHSCMVGQCRSCATEVVSGTVDHRDSALSMDERKSQRLMCPCVSRAVGKKLRLNL
ncbi:2Fe-2S iron-sulfur cluster-binding protein [Motiliproteus sediminis]|uniref:2Fe-2S iron-sulfur cluster-binding protein n=1 Tax=Motiliproteus sediminis TaxID=1468178 RepID=UPI001AEF693B|nr:2Fe-2S iron-sulfur cluster-binding protein [Motiliproteus sediminis]